MCDTQPRSTLIIRQKSQIQGKRTSDWTVKEFLFSFELNSLLYQ